MPVTRQRSIDISGMGGGYEHACQRMLWKGVAFLGERQPPLTIWDMAGANPNIYGVFHVEEAGLKELEKAMMRGEDGISGAMHQAVMGHLHWIHIHTLDGWLKEAEERDIEIIDWEGELMPTPPGGMPFGGNPRAG